MTQPDLPASLPAALKASMATVQMIAAAKSRGASWAALAPVLGVKDGKAAKREAKRLARETQRALVATGLLGEGAGDDG